MLHSYADIRPIILVGQHRFLDGMRLMGCCCLLLVRNSFLSLPPASVFTDYAKTETFLVHPLTLFLPSTTLLHNAKLVGITTRKHDLFEPLTNILCLSEGLWEWEIVHGPLAAPKRAWWHTGSPQSFGTGQGRSQPWQPILRYLTWINWKSLSAVVSYC